jgi:hypothetical protein
MVRKEKIRPGLRNAPDTLDFARFGKVQGFQLFRDWTDKLHFATTQWRGTAFPDLLVKLRMDLLSDMPKITDAEFDAARDAKWFQVGKCNCSDQIYLGVQLRFKTQHDT